MAIDLRGTPQDLSPTPAGDECPLCQNGTVEIIDGETRCRGECGCVVPCAEGSLFCGGCAE